MSKPVKVWVACIGDAANVAILRSSRRLVAEWCAELPKHVAKVVTIRRATLTLDPQPLPRRKK